MASGNSDPKEYYYKGNDYYEKGSFDKAIENYNTAIILNPNFPEAYFNRGLCYYNKKDYDKSIKDYTKAADLDPDNPVIYNNRGDAHYRKQEYDKAIMDYDKAVMLNNSYLKAYYNRGLAYAVLEDYDKAVEDFTKVVELDPDFAEAYYVRGLAFEYLENADKAIENYQKALDLNPDLQEASAHMEAVKTKKEGGGEGGEGASKVDTVKLVQRPSVNFSHVAGMKKVKDSFFDYIVRPLQNPELARKYGKLGGGGLLLYGPPGCGKTFIVKAAAGESGVSFINAKLSDLLDMYVGNTEKNIHKVFEAARKNAPSILFIDELEALGGRREKMDQSATRSAINQLLYEMDGVEAHNENVLVIGATNSPWSVDTALRRSGRFSKMVYIPEPDGASRADLFKIYLAKRPLGKGIQYGRLGRATEGFSSADVKQICDDSAAIPWKEAFLTGKERSIMMKDILKTIKACKSTLPPWYASANTEIGKQKEIEVVDGKKHVREKESKLGPEEQQQFRELLDVIKRRNQWWNKGLTWIWRQFAVWII